MNQIAIGLSVVLSFVFSEFLGLASGGMVSAGYLALFVQNPLRLVSTIVCAILVWLIVLLLQKVVIIYGRRRFAACVLIGFALTWIWSRIVPLTGVSTDIRIIGYIIPGLIANDILRQGVVKTVLVLLVSAFIIKLILLFGLAF